MAESPSLRVSDADRDRVSARLREAYAEGRLTPEEFHERTDAALAAKTVADLASLTADLPAPSVDAQVATRSAAALARRTELRRIWTGWVSMAILLSAVWLLTAVTSSSVPAFWPVWPLGITGAMCLVRTINLRNADEADDRADGRAGGRADDRADARWARPDRAARMRARATRDRYRRPR